MFYAETIECSSKKELKSMENNAVIFGNYAMVNEIQAELLRCKSASTTAISNAFINSARVKNGNPAICSAAVELKRRAELKKSSQRTLEYCREMQSA
jgi:hypothetical protein